MARTLRDAKFRQATQCRGEGEGDMRRLADLVVRWPWAVIGVWVALAVALPLAFPSLA